MRGRWGFPFSLSGAFAYSSHPHQGVVISHCASFYIQINNKLIFFAIILCFVLFAYEFNVINHG